MFDACSDTLQELSKQKPNFPLHLEATKELFSYKRHHFPAWNLT